MFGALYCAIFRTPRFRKFLKFLGTPIASLAPETVRLPAFSILFAMFTGTCGPPEKLSLALVVLSINLRKIVKLVYTDCELHIRSRDQLMFFFYIIVQTKRFSTSRHLLVDILESIKWTTYHSTTTGQTSFHLK